MTLLREADKAQKKKAVAHAKDLGTIKLNLFSLNYSTHFFIMHSKNLLFFFFFIAITQAQKVVVQGQFVNQAQLPLAQVLIEHQDSKSQIYSDASGKFIFYISTQGSSVELIISKTGYKTIYLPFSNNQSSIDLGKWVLQEEDQSITQHLEVVDFDEINSAALDDAVVRGGILQSRRTVFLEAVSFQFSSAFFSQRGLHRKHQPVYINGLQMEDIDRGVSPWSHWGGLNDIMNRSQLVDDGLTSRADNFGGVLGSVSFDLRPSNFKKGFKFSQAFSNRSYRLRSMFSFHSPMGKNWSFSALGSFRRGSQGFQQGTPYTAWGGFLALEKGWKGKSSTTITFWYTPVERGRAAPLTQEVFQIMGNHYNPYWGFDRGKPRNARQHRSEFPYFLFNQVIQLVPKVKLQLNGAYSMGEQGDSRLLYTGVRPLVEGFIGGGRNPDPTYYQKLPSYFLRDVSSPQIVRAYYAQKALEETGQIQWEDLRSANATIPDRFARYAVYEDVKHMQKLQGSVQLFYDPRPNEFWNIRLNYRQSQANYFAQLTDLLGATQWYDIDPYAEEGEAQQNDLNRTSATVPASVPIQYNYTIISKHLGTSNMWSKQWSSFRLFLGGNFQMRTYQREGRFRNGAFSGNSFGLGERKIFHTWSTKAGIEISFSPRHQILLYGGQFQRPPDLRSVYPNPRESHQFIPALVTEDISSLTLAYRWQGEHSDLNIKGYWVQQMNINEVSFYFADGVGGDEAFFIQEVLQGKSSLHQGLELGFKHSFAEVLDLKIAAAYGKHQYVNSPNILLYTEPSMAAKEAGFEQGYKSFGQSNLKGYYLANGPQRAYSLGLQYNDPNYWRINFTGNYFSHAYLQPNPLRRTRSFLIDSNGILLSNYNKENYSALLSQERFPAVFVLNATAGKSWKIKRYFTGFFMSFQNLLNATYKIGGFEQGRNANYMQALEDHQRNTPIFGPKYWWSSGSTYFISTYFRF